MRHQNNGHGAGKTDAQPGSVLITGAAGFGGSYLTRALLHLGYRVTGLDTTPPSHAGLLRRELEHPNFRYLWKSLQDIQPDDVDGHSVVAHLAAQADTPLAFDSPRYTVMQNIDGTVALLEAVRRSGGIEKLLYAGSGNEIGRPLQLPIDESHPLTPHNPYGFSKAAAELAVWSWQRAYGVPAVVLSTGVVIGPRMRREVFIFKWLWNAMHGRPIVVEGGQQTRDLSFIDDVVAAWALAIQAPPERVVGEKFFVSCGEERTVAELAEWCRDRRRRRRSHRARGLPARRGGPAGSLLGGKGAARAGTCPEGVCHGSRPPNRRLGENPRPNRASGSVTGLNPATKPGRPGSRARRTRRRASRTGCPPGPPARRRG